MLGTLFNPGTLKMKVLQHRPWEGKLVPLASVPQALKSAFPGS